MHKLCRKLLSAILACALVAGLLPGGALGANSNDPTTGNNQTVYVYLSKPDAEPTESYVTSYIYIGVGTADISGSSSSGYTATSLTSMTYPNLTYNGVTYTYATSGSVCGTYTVSQGHVGWSYGANNGTATIVSYNCWHVDMVATMNWHSWDNGIVTKEATCTSTGTIVYSCTKGCGETKTMTIPMLDHTPGTPERENETAATCVSGGSYDLVTRCTECGTVLKRETITSAASGHTAGAPVKENEIAATCTAGGSYDLVTRCTVCDTILLKETIKTEPAGHTAGPAVKENEQEATCTTGSSYDSVVKCTVCGTELSRTTVTGEALGHDYVLTGTADSTCTEDGVKSYTCTRDSSHTKTEAIDKQGHTAGETQIKDRVEPTCTTDGSYDEVISCVKCDAELSRQTKTIDKLGHDLLSHEAKAPNCSSVGWDDYDTCSRCDYTTYAEKSIDPDAHDYQLSAIDAATCTQDGMKTYTCTNDSTHIQTETIPMLAHTPGDAVKQNLVAPTCTEAGSYDLVTSCVNCQTVITSTNHGLEALGHDYQLTGTADSTCTEDGVKTYTCTRDSSHTKTEAIDKQGHTAGETQIKDRVEPTCTTDGSYDEVISCVKCDAELSRQTKTIDKLGHKYGDWTDTKDSATHTRVCANDTSHVETEEHEMSDWSAYTRELDQTSIRVCKTCDYTETRTRYTVTFNSNGGSSVDAVTVDSGKTAAAPTAPTRSGYTFTGWTTADGTAYDFTSAVTESITLIAQWRVNSVPVQPPVNNPVVVTPPAADDSTAADDSSIDSAIDIVDEDVPLAGTVDLLDDHIAYIQGYSDDTVRPNASITREEVATIFYRLLSDVSHALYDTDENDFTDVSDTRWSNTAISTLANAGILEGDNGLFRPSDKITRAEFATIVARFWVVTEDVTSPFTDTAGHWAEQYIAFSASRGWVNGYTDGTFRPQQSITRAEAVKLINRMLDREVDEEGLLEDAIQFTDNADQTLWYYYEVLEAANGHEYARRDDKTSVENWTALTQGVSE